MTEEELYASIELILIEREYCGCSNKGCQDDLAKGVKEILALIREAGYKSPEEVKEMLDFQERVWIKRRTT